mmetsp:Transcript_82815/g.268020  ORF Transcript_82815/g.268020 Transcript_82815/m.268020 type:complete len:435 (-) Transcript_82815:588-1892(-)
MSWMRPCCCSSCLWRSWFSLPKRGEMRGLGLRCLSACASLQASSQRCSRSSSCLRQSLRCSSSDCSRATACSTSAACASSSSRRATSCSQCAARSASRSARRRSRSNSCSSRSTRRRSRLAIWVSRSAERCSWPVTCCSRLRSCACTPPSRPASSRSLAASWRSRSARSRSRAASSPRARRSSSSAARASASRSRARANCSLASECCAVSTASASSFSVSNSRSIGWSCRSVADSPASCTCQDCGGATQSRPSKKLGSCVARGEAGAGESPAPTLEVELLPVGRPALTSRAMRSCRLRRSWWGPAAFAVAAAALVFETPWRPPPGSVCSSSGLVWPLRGLTGGCEKPSSTTPPPAPASIGLSACEDCTAPVHLPRETARWPSFGDICGVEATVTGTETEVPEAPALAAVSPAPRGSFLRLGERLCDKTGGNSRC